MSVIVQSVQNMRKDMEICKKEEWIFLREFYVKKSCSHKGNVI